MIEKVTIRNLGLVPYSAGWHAMQDFTSKRIDSTIDEFWCLEHPPVFTQGQAGKPEHILKITDIPIIQTDRGGQVTYHGPGQLVVYLLVDIKRKGLGVRTFVNKIEQSVIDCLQDFGIQAKRKCGAPGIFVDESKICSLGLRIRKGASFHGLSFNIDMDLTPFEFINPCGFSKLKMVQVKDFVPSVTVAETEAKLIEYLSHHLEYTEIVLKSDSFEYYENATIKCPK